MSSGSPGDLVLDVRDLAVSFQSREGTVEAVRGLSFRVRRGELLSIVGESGSGKSVSSLAIMGLLPESASVSGQAFHNGVDVLTLSDREMSKIRGRTMAMVFQDPLSALTPVYTVGEQIAEAVRIHRNVSKAEARNRAIDLLQLVGLPRPKERAAAFPHEFSGGMRQRVMIAMAIANDPELIIADEPTTALDVTVQAQILEVLHKAQEVTNAGILLVTHDLGIVASISDRVMIMYAGRAIETGSVDDLFARPTMPYTVGLLGSLPRLDDVDRRPLTPIDGQPPSPIGLPAGCPFAPRCPLVVDVCSTTEPVLTVLDSPERAVACHRHADVDDQTGLLFRDDLPNAVLSGSRAEIVVRVDRLIRHYQPRKRAFSRKVLGTVHAVDGVSFDVRAAETLAIVGESGCGKSTLLLEMMAMARPASGTIELVGIDTATLDNSSRRALRRDVAVVFQDPMASLDPRLTIYDVISEPLQAHGVPDDEVARRVYELIDLVGLSADQLGRFPAEFSGGQRQRVGIARALALEPKLVLLDEPVSALDVSVRAGVLNLLESLQRRLGLAYVIVSHDLSVVRHIADRVAVMHLGEFVEVGDVDDVFERPTHPYTAALLSAIPIPDPVVERQRFRIVLDGDPPSALDPPRGCRFASRCYARTSLGLTDQQRCDSEDPILTAVVASGDLRGHNVACHFPLGSTVTSSSLDTGSSS
jgi:peptide/nickel transport system ATP-binding protein